MSLDISAEQGADVRPRKPKKGTVPGTDGKSVKGGKRKKASVKKGVDAARRSARRTEEHAVDNQHESYAPSKPDNISQEKSGSRDKDGRDKALSAARKSGKQKKRPGNDPHKSGQSRGGDHVERRFRPRKNIVYSAIDLGTNNCRLLIAKQTKNGFRVIDAFSRIVRLGEGVARDNRLSEEAMDRTIEALKVCAEKLARRNVTCMRHVATEACRIADNSDEFVARVKRETGINLDVISTAEEARLAVLGCQSLIAPDKKNVLVFDIGGGSTELIWVKVRPGSPNEIRGWLSVPWGVVNLTEKFAKPGKTPKPKKYQKMIATMTDHLQAFEEAHELSRVLRGRRTQFLGTSGTVTTLASLHLGLPRYIRDRVDGAWMKSRDIGILSRRVAEMTPEERAAEPCIGTERADLVVAGCAILEAILNMWPVPSLRVADRGIREGILRGLMELDEPPRHVHDAQNARGKNVNTKKHAKAG